MSTIRKFQSVLLVCLFAVFPTNASSDKQNTLLEINKEINLDDSLKFFQRHRFPSDGVDVLEPRRALRTKRDLPDYGPSSSGVQCDASAKYRTADGTCNNLANPRWGSADTCQQRLMPAYYVGTSGYRQSVEGGQLPLTRILSSNLNFDRNRPAHKLTRLHMFMGQLITHDISFTPKSTAADGGEINCCPPENMVHESCKPIFVPKDDPFFKMFNVTCMNFVRSLFCNACTNGPKQLKNGVTSFIDASFVYGNSEKETHSLRTNDGTGRLQVQKSAYGDLLPAGSVPKADPCTKTERSELCFRAGDARVNQHITLTSLQTIFMREHNRMVQEMARVNPGWDDEKLFQEARRILGAVTQSIVYKEYLPAVLGEDAVSRYGLGLSDRRTAYDPALNPTIAVEFSTGAFRLHSQMNSRVTDRPLPVTEGQLRMRDLFFRPFGLYNGSMGPLLEEVAGRPPQQLDRFFVTDATNYMLRKPGNDFGLDLPAVDMTRGRDHGLPPYVDAVRYCTRFRTDVRSFDDLVRLGLMEPRDAQSLQQNYRNVRDVDFWSAMNMEVHNDDAVVGPTAACIIARQFSNLKYGDRFYVEHGGQSGSFTDEQLAEIRRSGLSSVLCANTDTARLPLNPMLSSSESNPLVVCSDVRTMDLTLWKD